MQKKPAEKAADVIKTAEAIATEKVAETEAAVNEAEEIVAETAAKAEDKVAEVKAAAKSEEKKAPAKKTAMKKAATKKPAAKKDDLVPEVYIQYQDREDVVKNVVERAKVAYVADGHKASAIKSLQVYLKPEENAAYYVINEKYAGKVYLF